MSQWRQGTCRPTNGSQVVVFDNASLADAGIAGGELFFLPGSGIPYIVAGPPTSLGSPTQEELTLTSAYQGATQVGVEYAITTSITPNQSLPYPEFNDIDTPAIVKELAVLLDSKLGSAMGTAAGAGRVVYLDASGNFTTEAALAYNASTDTLSAVNFSGTTLTLSGTGTFNGNVVLGDASGDSVTVNAGTVSIPNNLNFDSNTLFLDAGNDRVVAGHSSSSALTGGAAATRLQVHGTSIAGSSMSLVSWAAGASASPKLQASKSRSGTIGTYGGTTLGSGDDLFELDVFGDDGTDMALAASLMVEVDGSPGSNDMPGRWTFSTSPDGTQVPVDRFRIDSVGNIILNQSGSALATNATGGFAFVPSSAGVPTGTPGSVTGAVATEIDSTNEHLDAYINGAWKTSPMGTFLAAASSPVTVGANVGPQVGSPTGVSIKEWLSIKNASGVQRFIPLFG